MHLIGEAQAILAKAEAQAKSIEMISTALKEDVSTYSLSLTLSLPSTTIVPYANSLDPDETPCNSPFHPDTS